MNASAMEPSTAEAVVKGAGGWVDVDMVVVLANATAKALMGAAATIAGRRGLHASGPPHLNHGSSSRTARPARPMGIVFKELSRIYPDLLPTSAIKGWDSFPQDITAITAEDLFGYEPNVIHRISLPDHERLIGNVMGMHIFAWIVGQPFVEQQRLRDFEELARAAWAAHAAWRAE
eukprot:jgi/Tetstr1/453756/TSEL_040708.t1